MMSEEAREAVLAALNFYASPATYQRPLTEHGWGSNIPIQYDLGKRAREALAIASLVETPGEGDRCGDS